MYQLAKKPIRMAVCKSECATMLGVSVDTVTRLMEQGRLSGVCLNRKVLIRIEDIHKLMAGELTNGQ